MLKYIGALALLAFAFAGAANAQSIDARMAEADAEASAAGFVYVAGPFHGGLADDATDRFIFPIVAGAEFTVLAFCDSDCSDLDLKGYEMDGSLVVSDVGIDAAPSIMLTAENDALATVEVVMASCARAPCAWRAKVWLTNGQ